MATFSRVELTGNLSTKPQASVARVWVCYVYAHARYTRLCYSKLIRPVVTLKLRDLAAI